MPVGIGSRSAACCTRAAAWRRGLSSSRPCPLPSSPSWRPWTSRPAREGRASSRELPDDLAEALAALLEVLEGVEAGGGRREQDHVLGPGRGGGAPHGVLEVDAAMQLDPLIDDGGQLLGH